VRAIVLDTKGDAGWSHFARDRGYRVIVGERAGRAAIAAGESRILIRCLDPLGPDANAMLLEIYRRRQPQTVIVDEALHWPHDVSDRNAYGLRLTLTAGAGLGIGVWAGAQRPVDVLPLFISESGHRVIFRQELASDRRKLAGAIPGAERAGALDAYWWLYHSPGRPLRLMRPI
jgi:hypothetical protein